MKTYKVTVDNHGIKCWYNEQDQLHREDGPAIEYASGDKYWYRNGKLHREDGPAMECANGTKYWYINDNELTEAEFNARIKQSSCDGKVVEIDGKKYKLQAL
jgi:hypothetical protein